MRLKLNSSAIVTLKTTILNLRTSTTSVLNVYKRLLTIKAWLFCSFAVWVGGIGFLQNQSIRVKRKL